MFPRCICDEIQEKEQDRNCVLVLIVFIFFSIHLPMFQVNYAEFPIMLYSLVR